MSNSSVYERYKNKKDNESTKFNHENNSEGGVLDRYKRGRAQQEIAKINYALNELSLEGDRLNKSYKTRFVDKDGNYINAYRADTQNALSSYEQSKAKLEKQAQDIMDSLSAYEKYLDADNVKSLRDYLTAYNSDLQSMYDTYQADHDYFSQWADEDAYKEYQKYREYEEMSSQELEEAIRKATDEKEAYEKSKGGKFGVFLDSFLSGTLDVAKSLVGQESTPSIDATPFDYNAHIEKLNSMRVQKAIEDEYNTLDEETKSQITDIMVGGDNDGIDPVFGQIRGLLEIGGGQVGESEKAVNARKALKAKGYTDEEIRNLVDLGSRAWQSELNRDVEEEFKNFGSKHPAAQVLQSGFTDVVGGLSGTLSTAQQYVNQLNGTGSEYGINTDTVYHAFTRGNIAADTQAKKDHNWNVGEVDAFDVLYDLGSSVADNVTRTVIGGGSTGAGVLMGTQVFNQSVIEGKEKGYSDTKAVTMALTQASIEALTEKYSIEAVLGDSKTLGRQLLKSFVAEGSEGVTSNWLNRVLDVIANGNHSEIAKAYESYISSGCSKEEALTNIVYDLGGEDLETFLLEGAAGFVMGGGVQGSRAAVAKAANAIDANKFYNKMGSNVVENNNVSQLVGEAKSLGNSKLNKLANVAESVNAEELSTKEAKKYAHQVGKLYKGVQKAQFDSLSKTSETAFRNVIKAEVEKTGVADVDATTDILVKAMHNKGLTRAESQKFQSVNGRSILDKALASAEFNKALDAEQKKQFTEGFKKVVNTNNLGRDINAEKKADLLSGNKYTLSSDDKITIDATDEDVNSMLITSLDGDDITLDVETGDKKQTVLAGELRLNEDYAVIFEGLRKIKANFGLDETTANNMLTLWKRYNGDSWDFYKGIESSFMFGKYNMRYDFEKSIEANKLPEDIRNEVYEMGREYRQKAAKEESASLKKNAVAKAKSKITFAKGVTYEELNESQKVQVDLARIIAEKYGFDLEIFRSPKKNGVSVGESGSYDFGAIGSKMRLDVDAGTLNGKSLIIFTQSHELTHYIKEWSPEKYKVFADFLIENYNKKGVSVDALVRAKIANSVYAAEDNDDHEALDYDRAFDEVVAESCVEFLKDPNLRERILDIEKVDKGLAQKIKDFLKNILAKLEKVIKDLEGQSKEAEHVREFDVKSLEKLKNLWVEALADSRENVLEARKRTAEEQKAIKAFGKTLGNVEVNDNGDITLMSNKDGTVQMYSEATWLNGGKEALINALTRNEHTAEEIKDTIKMVEESLDYLKILAAGDAEMRGYTELSNHLVADVMTDVIHGKQVLHTIVNNGDYPVNLDLALICKKRVAYMRLMSRLIEDGVMEDVRYDGDAIAKVNEILRKNGFETACLGCFVESRRLQFQTWAEVIVQEWNGEVDRRNKNAGDFNYAKNALADASSLTEEEIARLEKELEGKKTNDQGNLNLGSGSVRNKMGKLLDQVPTLQKHITVADLLTPEGITKLRAENPNLFSLVKSRYGAASPKIVQNYNPYAGEIANLTFESVKKITTNAVSGAADYIAQAKKELYDEYFTEENVRKGIITANELEKRELKRRTKDGESKAEFDERNAKWKEETNAKVQTLAMRKYLYDIGGARMQSFSDFMIENVFDYLQIFADLSANRFPLHSYTKEAAFLRLFGMTGAKINGSLIAHVDKRFGKQYAGLLPAEEAKNGNAILVHTADGDFAIGFDDYARHLATKGTKSETFIQSIGMKDIIALQLDKRYSSNVGSITIGVSDIQILAMLDSPLFRMVIPYHASGMLPQFAELVGVDLYNDYTDYQNTTVRQYYDINKMPLPDEVDKDGKVKQGKLRKANGDEIKADTSYSFNAELQKIGDPKQVANNYIAWCNEFHEIYDGDTLVGYAKFNPKFSNSPYGTDFTKHENYYKLLEDFNVYDGITEQYAAQGAVQMIFPSADNRLSAQEMEEYKQRLRDTGIFNEKEIEKYAQKANMTFDELVKAEVENRIAYEDVQEPKFEATVKEVETALLKGHKRIDQRIDSYDDYIKLKESDSKKDKELLRNMKPMTGTYGNFDRNLVDRVEGKRHYQDRTLSPIQMENRINELREEISWLEVDYESALSDDDWRGKRGEQKQISNKLTKLNHELDKLIAEEKRAAVKTPLTEIHKNLSKYRRSDLESIAEQLTEGNWDDYEDLSRDELEAETFEVLTELISDLTPEEANSKKFGLYVRPVNDNLVHFPVANDVVEQPTKEVDLAEKIRKVNSELEATRKSANNTLQYVGGVQKLWQQLANHEITPAQYNESLRKDASYKALDDKVNELEEELDSLIKELEAVEGKEWRELRRTVLYGLPSKQTLYQDRPISDREVLVDAMENIEDLSIEDQNRLEIYKGKIDNINELEKELADVGKQIHKIITTKGSDRKQMAELNAKAETLRKQISRVDGELLKIEAMKPIQNLVEIRKKQIIKAQNQKAQEQRHKSVEGRNKTATKNKIKRVVKELDKLLNKGNKKSNVKDGMQDMVRQALALSDLLLGDVISAETILSADIPDERLSKNESAMLKKWRDAVDSRAKFQTAIDNLEAKYGSNKPMETYEELVNSIAIANKHIKAAEKNLSELLERERKRLNSDSVKAAIESLSKAYEMLKGSNVDYISSAYDENISDKLKNLVESLEGVNVKDMSMSDLQEVYTAYKMVLTTVRNANKLFVNGRKENFDEINALILQEINSHKEKRESKFEPIDKVLEGARNFTHNNLKPLYFFEELGSNALKRIFYDEIARAQRVYAMDWQESREYIENARKKHNYYSWNNDYQTIKLLDGRTVKFSMQELMSIYAYSKRAQADKHMSEGGFVFDNKAFFKDVKEDVDGKKVKTRELRSDAETPYRITEFELEKIKKLLGKERIEYVDDMQKYLSEDMANKGNSVTRVMYGIDIFNEKVYFPLKSSKDYKIPVSTTNAEFALKGSGFTKETVPTARNPIVLQGFDDVWAKHVNEMSTYHSLVLPIENMNKVLGYTEYIDTPDSLSTKEKIRKVYGGSALKYIENYIQDMNGGFSSNKGAQNFFAKGFSNFKKTAVGASMSTVIQQPTAVLRAMAMIKPKYFVKYETANHKALQDEMLKYAPISIIKQIGGFDAGGNRSAVQALLSKEFEGIDKAKAFFKDKEYRKEKFDDAMMLGATFADEIGWNIIWNAVKNEVKDTTTFTPGSDEFFNECGNRFDEVVNATQVYDSVLSRSGYMRSNNELVKMSTAFMGEPSTSFNMLYNAVTQAKRGNISKSKAVGIVTSVYVSVIAAAALKSLIYALRDDDDEESYVEKYMSALVNSLSEELFVHNMLPFLSDIATMFDGWEVERTDMAVFKDVVDAVNDLDSDSKSPYRKAEDLFGAFAGLFGIPLKNVSRTGREIYNMFANILDDNTAGEGDILDAIAEAGWNKLNSIPLVDKITGGYSGGNSASDVNVLLDKGNTAKAKEVADNLIAEKVESGKTEKEAKASVKASVTSYWKDLYLQAYVNKDNAEMLRIRRILQATGLYDDVLTTCSNWIKGMKDEDPSETRFKKQ